MTTEVEVLHGYLCFRPEFCAVPPAFWKRVRAAAEAAGRRDELAQEYRAKQARVREARATSSWWGPSEDMAEESAFFRRWVLELFGEQALWPWSSGWSTDLVEVYPVAAPRRHLQVIEGGQAGAEGGGA